MSHETPENEVEQQLLLLAAIETVLSHGPIAQSAAAGPLLGTRDWINSEFDADSRAEASLRSIVVPADLRRLRLPRYVLGRCLRRATERFAENIQFAIEKADHE